MRSLIGKSIAALYFVACITLVSATAVSLAGCPAVGIPNPLPDSNSIVVHNQTEDPVDILSITRISDECSDKELQGINLLPEPLEPGKSFTVKNLPDGRYFGWAPHDASSGKFYSGHKGFVNVSGGVQTDWFLVPLSS